MLGMFETSMEERQNDPCPDPSPACTQGPRYRFRSADAA
jgi:hypothetical protein